MAGRSGQLIRAGRSKRASLEQMSQPGVIVRSPLSGTVVSLDAVPSPSFAMGSFGAGIAVIPDPGVEVVEVKAPVAGIIERALPHVYVIEVQGYKILMQLGVDTARLEGQGFARHVREGDAVGSSTTLCTYVPRELGRMGFDPSVLLTALRTGEDDVDYYCFSGEPSELGRALFAPH